MYMIIYSRLNWRIYEIGIYTFSIIYNIYVFS